MLTAVIATQCAIWTTALTGRDWDRELPEVLGSIVAGGIVGTVLGGLSGLFDQSPLRGGVLGAITGGLIGITAVSAALIPSNKIDLAFHSSALGALCVFASALMGRWSR